MNCPKCQNENPATAKFCNECGAVLNLEEQPRKFSSTSEAARKRVTALFSDLSGYTSMTEKLDPEEVKEIMGRIFDGVKAVIRKYEGFIEKFAGDGVLALFGVPKAHEDDPIRAIHAAGEIHELVEALNPRYETKVGHALLMHSGINTGLVVTADVDPEKGTHGVTGEAINVAARLSGLADAGEILVGPDTHRASQAHFTFQTLKPVKVKGKSKHISIYKVLSEKAATAGGTHEMQISSEMVGRDQELAKLELHILQAVNGHGSVVNVFGEPGVGKSRLLAELRQRDVISRVSFLEGRSISIGKNLSFHPIIDLFKQWASIKEDDRQAEASNKLETAIRRVCGDEADEVFPFVATLMGMKLSGKHFQRVEGIEGEALEKLILKNVRELLARSSELIPIVIVMEDLHWADTTSLELLESLFRLTLTCRVVFINVFRPGYWQGDDRKIETLSEWHPEVDFTEIAIKPLDGQTGEALVNNMLQVKGLRNVVKQQIVDRAGGNPFFIEEIVRSLIDEGAIVPKKNGAFEVTEKIDHVVIPISINDVLTARIDRLEDQTRDLIKVASVIGRCFFDRILKEVANSIEGIDERLAYLKDAQFIRERLRKEELEYLFKHALAQEAAYESTLIQQRKALHLQVANSTETVFRDRLHEFYGMLAFHYGKGENHKKAEFYLIKAGEEALRSSASSEALNYYQEGLRLYLQFSEDERDPGKMIMFRKNIAIALYNKSRWVESIAHFDKVLDLLNFATSPNRILVFIRFFKNSLSIMTGLYSLFKKRKKPSQRDNEIFDMFYKEGSALIFGDPTRVLFFGLAVFNKAFKINLTESPQAVNAFIGVAAMLSAGGLFYKLSHEFLAVSKSKMDMDNIQNLMAYEMAHTSLNFCWGNWNEIKTFNEMLVDKALQKGEFWNAVNYIYLCSHLKIEQGDFLETELLIARLFEIGDNYDYDLSTLIALAMNTTLLLIRGQFHEARMEAEKDLTLCSKYITLQQVPALGRKTQALILLDDIDGARESILQAKKIADQQKFMISSIVVSYLVAQFMTDIYMLKKSVVAKKDPHSSNHQKKAYQSGKLAIKRLRKYAPHRTETLRLMGEYYWLIGNQTKALKWWNKAVQKGERLGARPALSGTYFEVGKRLLEPQSKHKELSGIEAKDYLEKAGILFEEMGLERDLDELDRLKADYGV